MESILQWGIDVIIVIQRTHGPFLDNFFRTITFMGEEEFYLILLPLIFWCIDFGLGARLAILFLISSWLNINLKDLLQQPRPFEIDQSIMISSESGYGLPSNHAQSAVVVWGSIAFWVRKSWAWTVAIILMILIGFSRVYLGVHFPTDVLAGWIIGVILLVVFMVIQQTIKKKFLKLNLWLQLIIALVIPIILLVIHPVNNTVSATGTLAGVGLGLVLAHRYISFNAGGLWWRRIIRFIIGVLVIFGLYMGFKVIFPGEESVFYLTFSFIRYYLIGIWVSFGAPWLFKKIKLS